MFRLYNKKYHRYFNIYDVRNDKTGFPQFLIFLDGQWLYLSAKQFTEVDIDNYFDYDYDDYIN